MTKRLSSPQLEDLVPLLGPLARLIARGVTVPDAQLETLLSSADIPSDNGLVAELKRWSVLLGALHDEPTPEMLAITEEALKLRGILEASAVLATQIVANALAGAQSAAATGSLMVQPTRLDFGMLKPGTALEASLEVEADSVGQATCDSDQVLVSPAMFGPGTVQIRVLVSPAGGGALWTQIRLISGGNSVDVPLVALWYDAPPDPTPAPQTPVRAQTPSRRAPARQQPIGAPTQPSPGTPSVRARQSALSFCRRCLAKAGDDQTVCAKCGTPFTRPRA